MSSKLHISHAINKGAIAGSCILTRSEKKPELLLKRHEDVTAKWRASLTTQTSRKDKHHTARRRAFGRSTRCRGDAGSASASHHPSAAHDAAADDVVPSTSRFGFPVGPVCRLLLPAVLLWALHVAVAGPAAASSTQSVGKLSLGQKVASFLRSSQWSDEAIVFAVATLPVLELRGAVPVAYWMGMDPIKSVPLAILGNALPVPFILLYLGKFAEFFTSRSRTAAQFFSWLFEHTRKKAGPVEEFKWLGLMLFVAVPLPGTGAWSGAIAAYILAMPFWDAFWANFCGVAVAGLIVNLLCSMGLREALIAGVVLFLISTFVWSFLRFLQKGLGKEQV